ncbi:MAG: ester cyclase [Planctomycetes bacterium]|nr:ester cyclase [Planctomycetota bacterium]
MTATDTQSLAGCVVDFLNGGGAQKLIAQCAEDVTVFAPITEEGLDPFAKRDASKLDDFVSAFRAAFPDVRYALAGVQPGQDSVTVKWTARGTHRAALSYIQPCGESVAFTGSCLLKFEEGLITEIRLAADIYDLLVATGAICAEPGQTRGQAPVLNAAAMDALRKAIVARSGELGAPFDKDTLLHAVVRFYASSEFDTQTFELGGAGQFPALLAFLRKEFTSIELALDAGVSQGHTTTFRGKARVERGGERLSYMFRSGFRSRGTRVVESWVEMQVPPTLREAFE